MGNVVSHAQHIPGSIDFGAEEATRTSAGSGPATHVESSIEVLIRSIGVEFNAKTIYLLVHRVPPALLHASPAVRLAWRPPAKS